MKTKLIFLIGLFFLSTQLGAQTTQGSYPITPVPFTSVKITDNFWGQRLKASREVTIPLAFSKCEETGRYENFIKAANPSPEYKVGGLSFDDTDVYKTIEGASYSMQTYPDKELENYIDSILVIVAAAQEPDGYLYTSRTMNPDHPHGWAGNKRWEKVEDLSHEFYNLGHMIEGAVAHYQATGKRNFLDIAIKYADCVEREIGDLPGKEMKVPGHQIAEMALAKLYVVTGEKKYLDLAKFFLDKRGRTSFRKEYSQSHKPVLEQDEAVGHAVRAAYMYAGMADVAALTGDKGYIDAIDNIWENVVEKKLYITGGIGARHHGEAFGDNYELPNKTAYCETCAAIGNVYWNHRLFLLHGEAKYYDVLERSLYNGLIAGVSLDGGNFFYPNPLESDGIYKFNQGACHRQPWFGCACCPSNISRFIPSLPGYVYAVKDNDVYVNLYMSNTSEIAIGKKKLTLKQTGNYPWDGNIQIEVLPQKKQQFALKLRIPGWVQGEVVPSDLYRFSDDKQPDYTVKVNGADVVKTLDKGYLVIDRVWKKGDRVELFFDMEPRIVKAHNKVEADRGRVAVERGPVVYCVEWCDNDFSIPSLLMPERPEFEVEEKPDMLSGINLLKTQGQSLYYDDNGFLQAKQVDVSLIPYYAWVHRGDGAMAVWLPQSVTAVAPVKRSKAESNVKIEASHQDVSLPVIKDGLIPVDGDDRSLPHYQWWPKQGTTEWITYIFDSPQTLSSSSVFWFDDRPWGGCRVPQSWKLYYQDESDHWKPVENTSEYPIQRGEDNRVRFKPVTAKAIKMEVVLPENNSSGVYEWSLD
ncbi:glycoside hydrolase family 127 protein [Bacteroidales bacterium OttesenSCG-928-L03]|nr:glycoside hydrolase family 127 protein [Bacteroidales bacterium OttesenSCG-928-L03]